jgi:membrane fusion protein, multidrug efflux system
MRHTSALLPLIVAAGLGCRADGAPPATAPTDAVPVRVATVAQRDVPIELRSIGTVSALSTVALQAQVDGQLTELRFAEGQPVHRGDLLFVIDPRPFEAALRAAEGQVAKDRANAGQTAAEAARFQRLLAQGVVSRDEWERVRAGADATAAAVQASSAAVETARLRLQYTRIHAPMDGRIGAILVHPGNLVKANETTLAVLNQIRPAVVEFSVPQSELVGVRRQMAVQRLLVEARVTGAREPITGWLSFVDNAVDVTTGTIRLRAQFPNADEILWPGQFVDVVLRVGTQVDAVVAPVRAVQPGQGGRFVYVVKPDATVELRPVEVGPTVADDVVVTRGLTAGETVVTEGQLRLAPGTRVDVPTAPPGNPPA